MLYVYFIQYGSPNLASGSFAFASGYLYNSGLRIATGVTTPQKMRTAPSLTIVGTLTGRGNGNNSDIASVFSIGTADDTNFIFFTADGASSFDWGSDDMIVVIGQNASSALQLSAEL